MARDALDALIVPGRVGLPRDLGPCAWQQWAGEGGHSGRPAGLEGDAKLQAIMLPARRGISCRSKTPTLVEHNSRSEGKFGPLLPYGPGLAPPCSIPIPDVRAWRGEIVGSRSALRDQAAVCCTCSLTFFAQHRQAWDTKSCLTAVQHGEQLDL